MRESQKIERLRLPFSSLVPVAFGEPPEFNPARFVWVKFQPELLQPFPELLQEAVGLGQALKPEHIVVSIPDDHDLASRTLLAPGVYP